MAAAAAAERTRQRARDTSTHKATHTHTLLVRTSQAAGSSGSALQNEPSTTRIGGIRARRPRASTDFAVPRRPKMATPPRPGSTAPSSSACLISSWPTTAASGNARDAAAARRAAAAVPASSSSTRRCSRRRCCCCCCCCCCGGGCCCCGCCCCFCSCLWGGGLPVGTCVVVAGLIGGEGCGWRRARASAACCVVGGARRVRTLAAATHIFVPLNQGAPNPSLDIHHVMHVLSDHICYTHTRLLARGRRYERADRRHLSGPPPARHA